VKKAKPCHIWPKMATKMSNMLAHLLTFFVNRLRSKVERLEKKTPMMIKSSPNGDKSAKFVTLCRCDLTPDGLSELFDSIKIHGPPFCCNRIGPPTAAENKTCFRQNSCPNLRRSFFVLTS